MKESVMTIKNLNKGFYVKKSLFKSKVAIHAVNNVSFDVLKGECLAVVGESGCGKSTIARLIMGLMPPSAGQIEFRGQDITKFSPANKKKVRRHIQIVFQDPIGSLNPRMKIGNSIMEPLTTHQYPREKQAERVKELLGLVGLNSLDADKYPHELSGGQLQRVGIARAMALNPELIILDEPTSSLDVSVQAKILKLLKQLQKELGLTYIFISHDLNVVQSFAQRVIVIYLGNVIETGPVEEVFRHPVHPYTRLLMKSIPSIDPDLKMDISHYPKVLISKLKNNMGCSFVERCPYRLPVCKNKKPSLASISSNHLISCHKAKEEICNGQ